MDADSFAWGDHESERVRTGPRTTGSSGFVSFRDSHWGRAGCLTGTPFVSESQFTQMFFRCPGTHSDAVSKSGTSEPEGILKVGSWGFKQILEI